MIKILLGHGASTFGSWIDFLAILTLSAYQFHASPYEMALVSASGLLPGIFLTKQIGQLLDSDSVVLTLRLSLLLRIGATVGIIFSQSIWIFVCFVALRSVFNSIAQPAVNVISMRILQSRESTKFYSILNLVNSTAKLLVPTIGAVASSLLGERAVLLVSIVFTAVSIAAFLTLDRRVALLDKMSDMKDPDEQASMEGELVGMLPLLWCVATYFLFVFMLNNQMALVLSRLQFDKSTLGILMSCSGAGNIVSSMLTAKYSQRHPLTGQLFELLIPGACTAIGFLLIGLTLALPREVALGALLIVFLALASSARVSLSPATFSLAETSPTLRASLQRACNRRKTQACSRHHWPVPTY